MVWRGFAWIVLDVLPQFIEFCCLPENYEEECLWTEAQAQLDYAVIQWPKAQEQVLTFHCAWIRAILQRRASQISSTAMWMTDLHLLVVFGCSCCQTWNKQFVKFRGEVLFHVHDMLYTWLILFPSVNEMIIYKLLHLSSCSIFLILQFIWGCETNIVWQMYKISTNSGRCKYFFTAKYWVMVFWLSLIHFHDICIPVRQQTMGRLTHLRLKLPEWLP